MNKILFFLAFFIPSITSAQNISTESRALFFAIDDYGNSTLASLNNPLSNAKTIAGTLASRYNFETEIISNPQKREIQEKLEQYRKAYDEERFQKEGQLLIFFSGHGYSKFGNGYFLPADANIDRYGLSATSLEYDELRGIIEEFNCQHILVIIDACYSASFDPTYGQNRGRKFGRPGEDTFDRTLADYKVAKSRIYFTSDAKDEYTPDNSEFAEQLYQGLRNARTNGRYLTARQLFSNYVEQARPQPLIGRFGSSDLEGKFLFFTKNSNNKTKGLTASTAWNNAKKEHTLEAYQFFLLQFSSSEFVPLARQRINKLECEQKWFKTKSAHNIKDYEKYIRECPETDYAELSYLAIKALKEMKPSVKKVAINLQMISVNGGIFQMGGRYDNISDEYTHQVQLEKFEIGRYEVTVEDFYVFCEMTGRSNPKSEVWSEGQTPIVHVSWYDAIDYCNWLSSQKGLEQVYNKNGRVITTDFNANGYRLPTEAEWEYAASYRSSGKKALFGNGKDIADPRQLNFDGSQLSKKDYSKVGIYRRQAVSVGILNNANSLGIRDMSGNVEEWCHDWFDEDYYTMSPDSNPKGPNNGRKKVIRGGNYLQSADKLLTTSRAALSPTTRSRSVGFRVARSL